LLQVGVVSDYDLLALDSISGSIRLVKPVLDLYVFFPRMFLPLFAPLFEFSHEECMRGKLFPFGRNLLIAIACSTIFVFVLLPLFLF
jgi:hypothetical protein